jgi:hypothetical protein
MTDLSLKLAHFPADPICNRFGILGSVRILACSRDKTPKTNARKIVGAIGQLALTPGSQAVAAFREIRKTVEAVQNEQAMGQFNAASLDRQLLALSKKWR